MSRQWRIEYPGAIYHVLSRGNNRQEIFKTDDDRHLFLELLEELSARFHVGIYAYVLMSNHITICCFRRIRRICPGACNGSVSRIRGGLI